MEKKKCLVGLFFFLGALFAQAQTQVIAHRGFWNCEGSAQNSLASLKKAAEAKIYGSEFDVWMTADGVIVVNHDKDIQGFVIADTPYKKLKNLKLKNDETLPTLDDYLKTGKKLDIQLILEIKPHKTKEQEDKATAIIVETVKKYRLQKQVEYISFSLNICEQLAKLTPDSEIAYLNGDIAPTDLKEKGINGIDYHFKVINQHPHWIEEAHRRNMKVNVWTVNQDSIMQKLTDMKVDYLTTDQPLEAKKITDK